MTTPSLFHHSTITARHHHMHQHYSITTPSPHHHRPIRAQFGAVDLRHNYFTMMTAVGQQLEASRRQASCRRPAAAFQLRKACLQPGAVLRSQLFSHKPTYPPALCAGGLRLVKFNRHKRRDCYENRFNIRSFFCRAKITATKLFIFAKRLQ